MRTTETLAWRPALFSLAICAWVGLQACSGAPKGRSDQGGAGGDEATGGKGTGGKATGGASGTGGKIGTGGSGTGGSGTGGSAPDAAATGGSGGSAGADAGSSGGTGGKADAGGGTGGSGTGGAGTGGSGMTGPPAGGKKVEQHVVTWYTFQDNTPVNSLFTSSGRPLKPYSSIAVPSREVAALGGYGAKIYVAFLDGRMMPNGTRHTGWVQIDDLCGDAGDDSYCYQQLGGKRYPNIDLYLGDFTKTGMKASPTGECEGPAGSGQELTDVYTGNAGANFRADYGGSALGTGRCGDKVAARTEQKGVSTPGAGGCWGYDGQDSADVCSACRPGVTCAR